MSVFVETVALGKWSDALMSAELQPRADWPVAGCECTVNWGRGFQNLGAEEFYAWMAANSNYGAGHVTG